MSVKRMLGWDEVSVKDSFICRSFELETDYLLSLSADRLLAGFRCTAGIHSPEERYGGWESTEIQGHTMGHYLAAMAQTWAASKNEAVMERLRYTIDSLSECQREDGYLFASPEELFDRVENRQPVWVPWYTMHKIVTGLAAVCTMTGYAPAQRVLHRLADWIAERVLSWSEETLATVLAVEYGGMNACLYETYAITGDQRHLRAARRFDELSLFAAMEEGRDILNGLHANTTIPKILGGLRGYAVTGEYPERLVMAENFFDIVTGHHTYLSGGNSEWERFGVPDILDAERTACNCETCNTHNMIALAQLLFSLTGKAKYAGYDAWAYVNTILSSQNHRTGMTTYFQPMDTGYFKVYSRPFDQFWCCTGTGMENFSKPWTGTAYEDDNALYISRLVSCDVSTADARLSVRADWLTDSTMTVRVEAFPESRSLAVRIPHWCEGCEARLPDGITAEEKEGFLYLSGGWTSGMEIELAMVIKPVLHGLPDSSNTAAYSFGPFMLSADMGTERMLTDVTGVDVTVPRRDIPVRDHLIDPQLIYTDRHCEFVLRSADGWELKLAPHFLKDQVRYGIYFRVFSEGSSELEAYLARIRRRQEVLLGRWDAIPVGNDQYELAHHVRGEKTDSFADGTTGGRVILPGGYVSYTMTFPEEPCVLCMTCSGELTLSLGDNNMPAAPSVRVPSELLGREARVTLTNTSAAEAKLLGELFVTGENNE